MNKFILILISFTALNFCGCATASLKATDFSYIYTEINATKEDIFNSLVKIINERNLPIGEAGEEKRYLMTEYIDTLTGIRKGVSAILGGITASQYAYIFEIQNTDDPDKSVLITRVLHRVERLGGGFQYFTNTKGMPFYEEAKKMAVKTKITAESKE